KGPGKGQGQGQGKSGGNQSNQKGESKSGGKSDAQANKQGQEQQKGTPPDQNQSSGKQDPGKSGDSQRSESPPLPSHRPLGMLESRGGALKWLVFGILALVTAFFVLRALLKYMSNFTDWARNLLDAWRRFWEGLFGGSGAAGEDVEEAFAHQPRPRP